MAFETKVILDSLLTHAAKSKTAEEVYAVIARMAKVEGMNVPSYKDMQAELGLEIQEEGN